MSKSALENFKQDYRDKLNGEQGQLQPIDFPELGIGQVYAREAITGHRKGIILNALQKEGNLNFCAQTIINCLLDANKSYIFNSGDLHDMMRECDSKVMERVALDINKVLYGDEDPEEAMMNDLKSNDDTTTEEKVAVKNSK